MSSGTDKSNFIPFVALLLSGSKITLSGKILVLPGEYSHWHNMRIIVDELAARNHSVTVLVHTATPTVKHMEKENFKYIVFKVNMEQQDAINMWQNFINAWMNQTAIGIQTLSLFWKMMSGFQSYLQAVCEGMLLNEQLIASLRGMHFDMLLYDPMMLCSDLLAETLGLPQVVSLRLTFAYSMERLCGQLPTPPSYVPSVASHGHLTDHMDFIERLENVLLYISHTTVFKLQAMSTYDKFYTKKMGKHDVNKIRSTSQILTLQSTKAPFP
uniref:Uncharacterized protein n=1 Tax=Pygocentrus nattereri TaxID=42514 RepID=A0AAR2IZ29_PYGNA